VTALDEMRGQLRASSRRRPAEPWTPPRTTDFEAAEPVLAFDATLSHTGWVLLDAMGGVITVLAKGVINPQTSQVGYLATWEKAHNLRGALMGMRLLTSGRLYRAVVEAPSVGGGHRTESSLIAGLMVSLEEPEVVAVSATRVSKVMLGDARVRKEERKPRIREAVVRLIPEAAGRGWNEHIRDAAATGLTHLYDQRQARLITTGACHG
jgi:Holliday junction resolvasome RuvABC endonuclease subunit